MDFAHGVQRLPSQQLPPTATKPVMPKALRACFVASDHLFRALEAKLFLPCADADFATILPALFFTRDALVKPPVVFSLPPLNTTIRARLPLAILLITLAFITLAFIAGFIAGFMAAFMAAFPM